MEITHNFVSWFEIPVTDMERAIRFYETVFDIRMKRQQLGPIGMVFFPWIEKSMGSAGGLVFSPGNYKPSHDGVLIYFTSFSGDVNTELSRVEAAGGKVLVPKRQISPDIGYMGVFEDTEGNRIAVHNR
jgi:uncharacterized protein